jgi:hypothetical protein
MIDFDRNDPGDLEDFVRFLLNIFLWIFYIIASIIMVSAIFSDGTLPPEPDFGVIFRNWLLS